MTNTKKLLFSTIIVSSLVSSANADFIGAEVGYATWSTKLTGDIRKGSDSVDFEKDLGYGDTASNSFIWAYIDHPIPLLPNIKIQQTSFSDKANGKITKTLNFGTANFNTYDKVSSELDLDQFDIIPYWRILDNWVNFDIGLNFKTIQGQIKIDTLFTNQHADETFTVTVPMLYAKARFDMPFSGISIEADGSYISYAGNKLSDLKAGIVYQSSIGAGATLGIRQQNLTLDDIDDIYGDINVKGIYAGVFFHF